MPYVLDSEGAFTAIGSNQCCVLRQVLDPDSVQAHAERVDRLASSLEGSDRKQYRELYVIRPWMGEAVLDLLCHSASRLAPVLCRVAATDCVAVFLSYTMVREITDNLPTHGRVHQDAVVVHPDVPFNVWMPLNPIDTSSISGLGFVRSETPSELLEPADRNPADLGKVWLPAFEFGDAALFHNRTLHFTTHYGSNAVRRAMELRYGPAHRLLGDEEPYLLLTGEGKMTFHAPQIPGFEAAAEKCARRYDAQVEAKPAS